MYTGKVMTRFIAVAFLSLSLLSQEGTLEAFGYQWTAPDVSDWRVENGELKMLVARPSTAPRRPSQYVVTDAPAGKNLVLECEVKRDAKSLILVYAWRDKDHFNYAHLSVDDAAKVVVHNGMFHVFGGERVRMSKVAGWPSLPTTEWTRVRLEYDAAKGRAVVFVNGDKRVNPALEAIDLSLGEGKTGLGSFFETAQFRNVRITAK
jgi:hypothetical protein